MKIYLSEPVPLHDGPAWVDDLAPVSDQPVQPVARPRRRLRNWHKFMLCYVPIMAAGARLLYMLDGAGTALVGLAIWLATMLIILTLAGRAGRL